MLRRIASTLLGIFIICVIGLTLLYVIARTARLILSLDQPLVVAILAASATILAATITVVFGKIFEKKKKKKYFLYNLAVITTNQLLPSSSCENCHFRST